MPEKENKRFETAAIASAKLGLPTTFQSELQGPGVMGAEAGRSFTPTAIVTIITRESQSAHGCFVCSGSKRNTGDEDTRKSDPRKPGNSTQGSNATKRKPENSSNGGKNGSTCCMCRDRIKADRQIENSRATVKDVI